MQRTRLVYSTTRISAKRFKTHCYTSHTTTALDLYSCSMKVIAAPPIKAKLNHNKYCLSVV